MFCLHDYGKRTKHMQLMQFTFSESRQKLKWLKRCFVLLWNCVSRPFSLAFTARGCQCGNQRRKVAVGSALSRSRLLAPCLPQGLHFPCSLQAAQTQAADSFGRSWIPLSHKSWPDRSFSQGLEKEKREQPKEKAPKPMMLMIYRSWQCYSCHCQAWEFISAWCYCPSPHVVNNSLTPFKHTPQPFQPPYPSMAQSLFILMGFLTHCFLSTNPESVI